MLALKFLVSGTQDTKPVPRAGLPAYQKMVLALVYMVLSLAPALLYGYSTDMKLLVDDDYVASV